MRFRDKIVVVTGAGSGIGRASVLRFAAEGATVIAADINAAAGAQLVEQTNGKVLFRLCDVSNVPDIKGLMDYAADVGGGIDVLYNNAGSPGPNTRIDEIEAESWDGVMALILRSVAMGIRYAVPHMVGREGAAIVNTASIAGHRTGLGHSAYSVAKAGVKHLSAVAAADLARHNIRVNSISPGLINSNLFAEVLNLSPEEFTAARPVLEAVSTNAQPVKRAGMPDDVAAMALFLASSEAAFITGTDVVVDGGAVMGERRAWDPEMKSPLAHLARPRL